MPVYRIKPDDRMVLCALYAAKESFPYGIEDYSLVKAHQESGGLFPHEQRVMDAITRLEKQGLVTTLLKNKTRRDVSLTEGGLLCVGMLSLGYGMPPNPTERYRALKEAYEALPLNSPDRNEILDEMDEVWYQNEAHQFPTKCAFSTPHCPATRQTKGDPK